MSETECNHQWIADKVKDFAYCDKCLCCIKNGGTYTKEEYKLLNKQEVPEKRKAELKKKYKGVENAYIND